MASALAVLLLLSACLFTVTVGGDGCQSYYDRNGNYRYPKSCGYYEHCCGTCDDRYCCSSGYNKLSESDQIFCNFRTAFGAIVAVVVILIVVFITCCCCPCCCIYKMCRKPRPIWMLILTAPIHCRGSIGEKNISKSEKTNPSTTAVTTQVTTVTNMQSIQQQGVQYTQYQPVPTQPGYGGQPMQMGPYQGQQYAPGPPPPYHIATSPGYPTCQSAYDGGQAMYPIQPPTQPGVAYMHSETSSQPPYNPAYVQPPNTGY